MALRHGLLAYYKCDEASGDLLDATGNTNTLAVYRGAPGGGTGVLNGDRTFASSADAASGNITGFAGGSPFTLALWWKTDDVSIDQFFAQLSTGDFSLVLEAGGTFALRDGFANDLITGGSLSNNTLAFVAITSDGSATTQLRVNAATASGSFPTISINSSSFDTTVPNANVAYDEIGVWNRVLTSTELDALYGSGTPPAGPGFGYALHFATQPSNAGANATITPSPAVEVLDETSTRDTSATDSITLAIGTNPASGTLTTATNPKSASAGLATFNGSSIDNSGTGYTLTASATDLTGATSSSFNVTSTATALDPASYQPDNPYRRIRTIFRAN